MPLMNIPYPRLLIMCLKFLDFANIDIPLGDPFFYKYMYLEGIKNKPVSDRYVEYGYGSSIFFLSYASKL